MCYVLLTIKRNGFHQMEGQICDIHLWFMSIKYSRANPKSEKDFQVKTPISALWLSEMKYKFMQPRHHVFCLWESTQVRESGGLWVFPGPPYWLSLWNLWQVASRLLFLVCLKFETLEPFLFQAVVYIMNKRPNVWNAESFLDTDEWLFQLGKEISNLY